MKITFIVQQIITNCKTSKGHNFLCLNNITLCPTSECVYVVVVGQTYLICFACCDKNNGGQTKQTVIGYGISINMTLSSFSPPQPHNHRKTNTVL